MVFSSLIPSSYLQALEMWLDLSNHDFPFEYRYATKMSGRSMEPNKRPMPASFVFPPADTIAIPIMKHVPKNIEQ
jgi:hypothetical protein